MVSRRATTSLLPIFPIALLWSLTVGISCSGSRSSTTSPPRERALPRVEEATGLGRPDIRVVALTDLHGYLEPCGCTSRPLGGLDRMAYRLRELARDGVATFFVLAGAELVDPNHVIEPDRAAQERIRQDTVRTILRDLHAVGAHENLTPEAQALLAENEAQKIAWVASPDAEQANVLELTAEIARLRAQGAAIVLLSSGGSRRAQRRLASELPVDFWFQGGVDEASARAPIEAGGGHILHAGRQGQGMLVLELHRVGNRGPWVDLSAWTREQEMTNLGAQIRDLRTRLALWRNEGRSEADIAVQEARLTELQTSAEAISRAPAFPEGARGFVARYVELPFDGPKDPAITARMDAADRAINDANRVAFADVLPLPAAADQPHYVGSETCQTCHAPAFRWWRSHPHGHAYNTLVERNKEFNLSCVGCHVTGYLRPGGSNVTHVGVLADVGCENCHGPASQHIANPSGATVNVHREVTENTCIGCHNQEHSDRFRFDAYVRTLRVPGHGLPAQ